MSREKGDHTSAFQALLKFAKERGLIEAEVGNEEKAEEILNLLEEESD